MPGRSRAAPGLRYNNTVDGPPDEEEKEWGLCTDFVERQKRDALPACVRCDAGNRYMANILPILGNVTVDASRPSSFGETIVRCRTIPLDQHPVLTPKKGRWNRKP